jgi:hypothetical protein
MKLFLYKNSFHDTTAKSTISPKEFYNYYCGTRSGSWAKNKKIESAAKRLQKKLCGISDCKCSDWKGVR